MKHTFAFKCLLVFLAGYGVAAPVAQADEYRCNLLSPATGGGLYSEIANILLPMPA